MCFNCIIFALQVSMGTSEVPINPSENQPPAKAPTVSIANESFSLNNGHVAKTYMLLLRVYCASVNACLTPNCDEGDFSFWNLSLLVRSLVSVLVDIVDRCLYKIFFSWIKNERFIRGLRISVSIERERLFVYILISHTKLRVIDKICDTIMLKIQNF